MRWPDRWEGFTILVGIIISLPAVVVLSHLFIPGGETWQHLTSTVLTEYITNTLLLTTGVGAGTSLIGITTAWLCTMYRFPGQRVFEWALLLPMAAPAYIIAYTYTGILNFAGPVQTGLRSLFGWGPHDYWFLDIQSLWGAILIMSLVLYPYVYLLARAAFLEQSICVLEVSRTLGCSRWESFRRVALPLARPSIIAGVSLAMMEAASDYGTVEYFGIPVFTTGIFRTWFGLGDPVSASQLASLLMMFVFLLVALERMSRQRAKYHHTSARYRPLPRYRLKGLKAILASLACSVPLFCGFILPAIQLSIWTIMTAEGMLRASFLRPVYNSLLLGLTTATIALIISLIMAYGLKARASGVMRMVTRIASMGYAVPGTVIAVGILVPFAKADQLINNWLERLFNITPGLLFSGTVFILLYAYLVRFFAVSFNTVEAGLQKIKPSLSETARILGEKSGRALLRVDARLMMGSILTAIVMVFVDVMKELPATLVLRPFNFNTLAVKAFELASDERLRDSAGASIMIVFAGLVPVILLSRMISRSRPGFTG